MSRGYLPEMKTEDNIELITTGLYKIIYTDDLAVLRINSTIRKHYACN